MTTEKRYDGPGGWHAVIDDFNMADVYCTDPECLGQYVTTPVAIEMAYNGRGPCVGCREAIALTEAAYRTFDPAQ